ncbi:MAG: DUF2142 domain-containing protein [Acidimicrobiaceae bacterium]|nr:DUF2142 domain-containing protein [Acidimicrobiaceae bacterium]
MGLFLILAVPPTQFLDEPNHFYRAYGISLGQLVAQSHGDRTGGILPDCLPAYMNLEFRPAETPNRFHPSTFLRQPRPCTSNQTFLPFENTALYFPVAYVPQSFALFLTRSLGLPLAIQFYAGRFAAFAAFILLAWTALTIAPWGRSVMLVVATWPMTLLGAASYSADTMTTALALILVACVLRARDDSNDSLRWFLVGSAVAVALGLSKSTYFVLAPLLFLVPDAIARSRLAALLLKFGAVAAVAVTSGAWYLAVHSINLTPALPPGSGTISPSRQLALVLAHPAHYAKSMVTTLLGSQAGYFTWETFVAQVGFFRSFAAGIPFPQPWVMVSGYLALAFAYAQESSRSWVLSVSRITFGLVPPALILANVVLIFMAGYLAATPVGGPLEMLQGRYLIPLIAVPLISLSILQRGEHLARSIVLPVALVIVMYVGVVLKVLGVFYGIG